jgi:hypothetical protein
MALMNKIKQQADTVADSVKGGISGAASMVGFVDASKKKLKTLVSEKEKMYEFIGMEVFDLYVAEKIDIDAIVPFCEKLEAINTEIEEIEIEIIKAAKNCECGQRIKKSAKFCASCGKTLAVESIENEEKTNTCECVCGAEIKSNMLMCMECGRRAVTPI